MRSLSDNRRVPFVALVVAVALIAALILRAPAVDWTTTTGPATVDAKALQAEHARAEDLKAQLAEAVEKLRRRRPPETVVDVEYVTDRARAEDLKRQVDRLTAQLARGRPTPTAGSDRARADDLKAQLDRLQAPRPKPAPVPVTATLTKAQIVNARNLFGLYTLQAPFDLSEVGLVQTLVQRKANIVGYFQNWSGPFRPDAIETTWRRGQIPLITWEPETPTGRVDPPFTLSSIIRGDYDTLIHEYAQGIHRLGLPVIIRLAHEMNGYWYPWSEVRAYDGSSINGNSRGEYAAMWRHVHDIFTAEGANDYTIWLWAPNRVDQISRQPPISEFYPGDDYVDWVGMSGYLRGYPDEDPTFDNVYARTLDQLRATTSTKPIVLAEVGATETGGDKPGYLDDFFDGLARNPDIAGFVWFNLSVSSMRWGAMQTSDWRINSSAASVDVFRRRMGPSGFGLPPTG